jgi:antitoxin MazE
MKVNIVRIGNSRGIRLPKTVLEQAGLENEAELEVRGREVVIRAPQRKPREGWAEAFAAAIAEYGPPDEELLLGDFPNEFDETEWTWPEDELRAWQKGKRQKGK